MKLSLPVKIGILLLYLLFHLTLMRTIRTAVFSIQANESIVTVMEENPNFKEFVLETRQLQVLYQNRNYEKYWSHKLPFGFFFLISISALIFVSRSWKPIYAIVGLHFMILLISWIFLYLGAFYKPQFLAVCDLLTRYLLPIVSLGIIPVVYLQNKSNSNSKISQ